MRRLIVATDCNLRITVAYVTSEEAEKRLVERLEWEGKSVLVWKEGEIQTVYTDDVPRVRDNRRREARELLRSIR